MDSGRPQTDELVAAARNGDAAAFERLVRDNLDAVYGHALRFFGDPQSAEDAVQEVFLKVYRTLPTFDGRSSFSTWLFRVTRNVCVDLFRAGKRRPVPVDPIDLAAGVTPDIANGVVNAAALEGALRSLPPEDRDAFNAITLFGLSYPEAGEALGVPAGTVKSRVFRARRALVGILGLSKGVA